MKLTVAFASAAAVCLITFQTNTAAMQNSVANVGFSSFTGGLNVNTISAGNVANIGTRF